jgi:hypothetical protein
VPVRDGEQCSIGFQPVPRDHCLGPVKSVTTGEWLQAVAQSVQDTSWKPLHCSCDSPTLGWASFKTLGEQY